MYSRTMIFAQLSVILKQVPKVRSDILSKLPVVGEYFVREIPPEDNPF